jgi:hypothetical protein
MNQKRVKKLKEMATLFFIMQPKGVPQKSVEQIYKELKKVHKSKLHGKETNPIIR